MPIRRTIGLSLACMVTSACAIDKPQESTFHYLSQENGKVAPDKSRGIALEVGACGIRDGSCGLVRAVGPSQFGKPPGTTWWANRLQAAKYSTRSPPLPRMISPTGLVREGDWRRQWPLGHRQNQRPRPIHARTHPRPLAARCRRSRYEACRGGGRHRRTPSQSNVSDDHRFSTR